jgi:hypothetical protein
MTAQTPPTRKSGVPIVITLVSGVLLAVGGYYGCGRVRTGDWGLAFASLCCFGGLLFVGACIWGVIFLFRSDS